jgi:hypothetical protein
LSTLAKDDEWQSPRLIGRHASIDLEHQEAQPNEFTALTGEPL